MQKIRAVLSPQRLRHTLPRAAVAMAIALDHSTRRPPVAALLVQQLLA